MVVELNALNLSSGASEKMGENTTLRDNSHPCDKSALDNESANIMADNDPQKLRKPAIKTEMKDEDIKPKSNSQDNFLRGLDDGG